MAGERDVATAALQALPSGSTIAKVVLRFSVDRSGHVLSHAVARNSGYPDIVDEVIAMIIRADPLSP